MYLIIGGDSLIGSTLSSYWHQKNILYHASTRHKEKASDSHPMIDIREIQSFQNLNNYKSAVICAAVTDMAACEIKPIESRAVNVTATIELIKKLINKKTHIVFLSTNQVFDGERPYQKPYAPHNPINEYGRQKAEVEAFLKYVSSSCILRLTKVIHPGLALLKKWEKTLSNGQPIFAFSDMSLCPVSINDVIQKMDSLVRQKAKGIFQLSGVKDISYFEFAQEFAKENGFSEKLVREDFWKDKIQFAPPNFTSLVNI